MQAWEYLQLAFVAGLCADSQGHTWAFPMEESHGHGPTPVAFRWANLGSLLADLGAEGWELTGVAETAGITNLFFKRPGVEESSE